MLLYQTLAVTSFQQNCSLLWCDQTNEAVLIDPGGDIDQLNSLVSEKQVDLKAVWLTHGHLDHIGAADEVRTHYKVPVIGPHIDDEFLFDAILVQCDMFGFAKVNPFKPDKWLDESVTLKLGNEIFEIIHTPGHTPGHIVLVHNKQKMLWVGDVIFKHSVGRTDFPRGNHSDLINSIKNKLLPLGDDYQFVPGHGPESSIGEERLHNPFIS